MAKSRKKHKSTTSYGRSSYGSYGYGSGSRFDDDEDNEHTSRSYGGSGYGGYGSSYSSGRYGGYGGYSSGRSTFSWGRYSGGFGSFLEEDDDSGLFIKNHEGYFTPKGEDVDSRIKGASSTKSNRDLVKELSRFFYYRMLGEKEYTDDKYKDLSALSEQEGADYANKKVFYEELWDKFIPGYSPLEKAMNVFSSINKTAGDKGHHAPAALRKSVENGMKFDEEVYMDAVYNELVEGNPFAKSFKADILNKISLVRDLGQEFKVEKEVEEKIVTNSRLVVKRMMRDYSQLGNVDLYQRLMPTFDLKLLTKDLTINVPVDRTEHKQKIIILVDYSGSMRITDKQQWVVAILMDRLRYVIKGEAEIFFSFFLEGTDWLRFHHIHDRATALQFWKTFSTSPNGGDTTLGTVVNYIGKQITSGRLKNLDIDLSKEKPEILAINDGQDSVKTQNFLYKTNAISLIDGNDELKALCLKNKGKYVIAKGKKVETFDNDGKRTLILD